MNIPIDIYLDTSDLKQIIRYADNPLVKGFTTNPTLMSRAGVTNYEAFARSVLHVVRDKPVSFEVVHEERNEVIRQAMKIQSWAPNVNVKVPMMNSRGEDNCELIAQLMHAKVHVNITAMVSLHHVSYVLARIPLGPAILSVFAGRLADTGQQPYPSMKEAAHKLSYYAGKQLLWASVREPVNISEAASARCNIITVPPEMLEKAIKWYCRDPDVIAADTARQFIEDAASAGLTL